jgi:hypothetical protein
VWFGRRGGPEPPGLKEALPETPPAPGDLTDDELLEAVAGRVVRMGLAVPSVFFLESTKPLSFVGSQALVFLEPFVQAFLTIRHYQQFTRLMEDRRNVEKLIQRVEALDDENRRAERERKAQEKQRKAEAKRAKAAPPGRRE